MDTLSICPCRRIEKTKHLYVECCEPLHLRDKSAENAEELMRSRYSAFVLNLFQYLIDTHHKDTRGELTLSVLADSNRSTTWLGLKILSAKKESVSFQVYFAQGEEIVCLHEDSKFTLTGTGADRDQKRDGDTKEDAWYYLSGNHSLALSQLPKRRELCFCGSKKKYKNCHCP